ncbi:ADP-ribosyltransferase [Nonomuraea mangrovi]|uniref:ADP-ribosyltransferase n=1 Tax=Nonomuraea mangrovi TaxID=2316207 RepID=A0ABW4T5R6_9ACTN
MGFDGCVVPEFLRPHIDWVTGMAWPEGDPEGCFRMADACVVAAHRVVAGTEAADPAVASMIGDSWNGAAQQAFVRHVEQTVGGRRAELVQRLIRAAISLNGVGVTIQHAQRMITFIVVFLLIVLPLVLWQAPWLLRPVLQVSRMSALQIRNTTLMLMGVFAGFGGAVELLVQATQIEGGRRDTFDTDQLLMAVRDGAINGLLTGLLGCGLGRLAPPALHAGVARAEAAFGERLLAGLMHTLPGQALQYGVAGSATTAISLKIDGRPLDWDLILKSGTAGALGADGQHLASPLLLGRRGEGGAVPPPDHLPQDPPSAGSAPPKDPPGFGPVPDPRRVPPDPGPATPLPAFDAPGDRGPAAERSARQDGERASHLAEAAPNVGTPPDVRSGTPEPPFRDAHAGTGLQATAARHDVPAVAPVRGAEPVAGARPSGAVPDSPAHPPRPAVREGAPAHRGDGGGRAAGPDEPAVRNGQGQTPQDRAEAGGPSRPSIDDLINQPSDPPEAHGPVHNDTPGREGGDGRDRPDPSTLPADETADGPQVRDAPPTGADGIRPLHDARNALAEGDVAGARAAADAAAADALRARRSPDVSDALRARADAEAVQAGRIADMAEVIHRHGDAPAERLALLKRFDITIEVKLFHEHDGRSGGASYDPATNTLLVRQRVEGKPPGEELVAGLNRNFWRMSERHFLSQEITGWNGLSGWSDGAARFHADSDYAAWVERHMTPQSERFTTASREALRAYRRNDTFPEINQPLRQMTEPSPEAAAHIADMDAAMLQSVVPEDIVVSRQVLVDAFDRPMDRLEGTTQEDLAFLSTSTNKHPPPYEHFVQRYTMVKIWLRVPAGTHAVHMRGLFPDIERSKGPSSELLLARGSRYRVDKVLVENNQYKVFTTVLRDED